jgi:hypothetical protein
MVTITELKDCVSRNDVEGFLRSYILLLLQGTTLSLPTSRLKETLLIQWKDCIPKSAQFYTDDFIEKLSNLWLEILTEQGDSSSDRLLEELLTILNNKIKKTVKKAAIDPLLNEVSLKVSDDYYNDKKARESALLPIDELVFNVRTSIKKEQTELFLIAYLGIVIQNNAYKVPRISIPEKIQFQWRRILNEQLKLKYTQNFLEQLSSKWFYLLNKKGIPASQHHLKEILYFVKANAKEESEETKKNNNKSDGFFTRLFKG